MGSAHRNPALDTRVYEVRFPDKRTEELAANVIAETVYAQCDANGNQYVLLDAIVDYHKDPSLAVARDDQVMVFDGKKIIKCSTRGWELCCKWKDGSVSWQKLSTPTFPGCIFGCNETNATSIHTILVDVVTRELVLHHHLQVE